MSNEVRDIWNKLTAGETFSFTADGAKRWAYCFETFLDQFEGKKIVDEVPRPEDRNYGPCNRGIEAPAKAAYYNLARGKIEWLCKSCLDKQCPEPAAKPAEPEPWAEFVAACQKEHVTFSVEIEEAWWKEQERRISRMISEELKTERAFSSKINLNALADERRQTNASISAAIKAERAHLAIIADDEGMCGMARVFKRASK